MKETQKDIIDESVVNLLQSLPPPVAERVREKYDADRAEFLQVVKDMKPSSKPDYWAKRSCTKCYGRGTIGKVGMPDGSQNVLFCKCADKQYSKWLTDVRRYYNALKGQSNEQTPEQTT